MAFLTEARVRAARPHEKAYKVFDSLGLYLKVETSGGRLWRFKYRYGNVEARGKNETAHRTLQRCGQVFRYAVATGRALRDPTGDLRGALAPIVSRNRAAITEPAEIARLMRVIWDYRGHPSTEAAFKLSALLFVRPGELRKAEWQEFDLERAEWRIPAPRMKMREQHIVPLASQAVDILRALQPVTNRGRYVFACLRGGDRPMSEAAITAALRRMGYTGEQISWHGFRTIASTCLNEQGFDPDLIELQLAHAERNRVRAAYNKAQRIADRRKMMQAWADYLDGLRSSETKPPACSDDADGIQMVRFERERPATGTSGWEHISLPRAANGPRRRLDN